MLISAFHLACRIFTVDEAPQPHFQINECPQSFRMIRLTMLVLVDERTHKLWLEKTPLRSTIAEHVFIEHWRVRASEPRADRNRKTHLWPVEDLTRQKPLHALAQNVLRGPASQFQSFRQTRREFDQLVIEKRHPALDRSGHAHLVLLHQQLVQVSLDVGVEQPV